MDSEQLKKNLVAIGCSEQDAAMAIILRNCMASIDKIAFPNAPTVIVLYVNESKNGYHAAYNNETGEYGIWVKNIMDLLKKENRINTPFIILAAENLRPLWLRRFVRQCLTKWRRLRKKSLTLQETTLLIGIHEVRHRMQFQMPKLRMFDSESKTNDLLASRCIRFVRDLFVAARIEMTRRGEKPSFIVLRTNEFEFDAKVVDTYALHKMDEIKSNNGIKIVQNIIFLQPDETRT